MLPPKCRHRNVATETSPPKCATEMSPPKCRYRAAPRRDTTTRRRQGGDDNSLAPAAAPTGHVAPAQVLQPRCSAQASLLPFTSDPRGWVRIAVEVRNEATPTARRRRDDDDDDYATTTRRRRDDRGQSLQPTNTLTVAAAPRCPHGRRRCTPGVLTEAAVPRCPHSCCRPQLPSQKLQCPSALTVAAVFRCPHSRCSPNLVASAPAFRRPDSPCSRLPSQASLFPLTQDG